MEDLDLVNEEATTPYYSGTKTLYKQCIENLKSYNRSTYGV